MFLKSHFTEEKREKKRQTFIYNLSLETNTSQWQNLIKKAEGRV